LFIIISKRLSAKDTEVGMITLIDSQGEPNLTLPSKKEDYGQLIEVRYYIGDFSNKWPWLIGPRGEILGGIKMLLSIVEVETKEIEAVLTPKVILTPGFFTLENPEG
jgi:hypothetical protein